MIWISGSNHSLLALSPDAELQLRRDVSPTPSWILPDNADVIIGMRSVRDLKPPPEQLLIAHLSGVLPRIESVVFREYPSPSRNDSFLPWFTAIKYSPTLRKVCISLRPSNRNILMNILDPFAAQGNPPEGALSFPGLHTLHIHHANLCSQSSAPPSIESCTNASLSIAPCHAPASSPPPASPLNTTQRVFARSFIDTLTARDAAGVGLRFVGSRYCRGLDAEFMNKLRSILHSRETASG